MYSPYQINAATFQIFTEQLCGTQVSVSQVSRAIQTLDKELESLRNKYLGEIARLIAKYRSTKTSASTKFRKPTVAKTETFGSAQIKWKGCPPYGRQPLLNL